MNIAATLRCFVPRFSAPHTHLSVWQDGRAKNLLLIRFLFPFTLPDTQVQASFSLFPRLYLSKFHGPQLSFSSALPDTHSKPASEQSKQQPLQKSSTSQCCHLLQTSIDSASPSVSFYLCPLYHIPLSLSLSLSLFPLSIDWAQQSYSCHPERGMNRRPPTEWLNFDRIPFLEPLGPLLRQTRPQSDSERYLERSTFNERSINGKVFTKN